MASRCMAVRETKMEYLPSMKAVGTAISDMVMVAWQFSAMDQSIMEASKRTSLMAWAAMNGPLAMFMRDSGASHKWMVPTVLSPTQVAMF